MGEIRDYFEKKAPKAVRDAIRKAEKKRFLDPGYPHSKKMKTDDYEAEIAALHIELVKLQAWVKETGERVAIVFEGRDAAGKGGTIKRFREYLNPRGARVVALSKPSDVERGQWYSSAISSTCRRRARSCFSTGVGTTAPWLNGFSGFPPMRSGSCSFTRFPNLRTCWSMTACASLNSG